VLLVWAAWLPSRAVASEPALLPNASERRAEGGIFLNLLCDRGNFRHPFGTEQDTVRGMTAIMAGTPVASLASR